MKSRIISTFLIIFLQAFCSWGAGVISTDNALKELNTNSNVKFIDTRDEKAFQQGHIPDAVLITNNDLTATINDIPGMAKSGEEIANVFKNKGIDRNNKIIVYSAGTASNDYTYAARIIALLNYVNIKDTYLMDGGYAKWFSEKKGNVNSVEMVSPSKLTYNGTDNKIIVDLNYVSQNLNNKNVIFVDARNADYYNGKDTDTRITRHGHIPGAININVATLTKKVNNYYVLINQNELLNIVYEKGFANPAELLNKTVISYCNTGVSASGDWFVFKYIGTHPDVRIYEGSMSEYSRTNLPLE